MGRETGPLLTGRAAKASVRASLSLSTAGSSFCSGCSVGVGVGVAAGVAVAVAVASCGGSLRKGPGVCNGPARPEGGAHC